MQAVADLSIGLATSILATKPQLLHNQLSVLPATLHMVALQAAFPGISFHMTLSMSTSRHKGADSTTPTSAFLSHTSGYGRCRVWPGGVEALFGASL